MGMLYWSALLAVAVAASVAGGDTSADRAECEDQLVGLAPCLPYVQGQARAPAPDCCGGLREVLGSSPKCLCLLVKDKDDPSLGFTINTTLALGLPSACGATNVKPSQCLELLHIPPGSKEAAVFSTGNDNGTSPTTAAPASKGATNGGGISPAATALAALTAMFAGYLLLLVPELSPMPLF